MKFIIRDGMEKGQGRYRGHGEWVGADDRSAWLVLVDYASALRELANIQSAYGDERVARIVPLVAALRRCIACGESKFPLCVKRPLCLDALSCNSREAHKRPNPNGFRE